MNCDPVEAIEKKHLEYAVRVAALDTDTEIYVARKGVCVCVRVCIGVKLANGRQQSQKCSPIKQFAQSSVDIC